MNMKRLMTILAAFVMTMLLFVSAQATSVDDVVVVSAPLRRSADVQDGMVRVWLKSVGDVSHLDVTVTGKYSVNGNTKMSLSTGDQVAVDFNKSTGAITFMMNGTTYAVSGNELRLRRHQADGDSALSIAQANRPKNLYPGDLQLLAVQQSDGTYRLYPIMHVYLEYYLYGVVPYEMSSSNPIEALKAQAVAARTYTMRAMNARASKTYDLNDTSSDQVYKGLTGTVNNATKAVDGTKGIVAMNNGTLTGTYYTASNGGQTESSKNAWGGNGYPYLKVKDDPFDALNSGSNRRRLTVYSDFDHESQDAELISILSEKAEAQLGQGAVIQTINSITPHTPKYAAPSRLYTKMDFDVTAKVGTSNARVTLYFNIFDDLETQLGLSINSGKNELWSVEKTTDGFQITVGRWGHGIGLSQRGAQQMARMGYTYDQILGFYYEGCERVQYTFTHTILPPSGSSDIITSEPPASITPPEKNKATVSLPGLSDVAPLRYTASENGKTLTGVPNGSVVTVLSKGSTWSLVQYGEINGYLPTDWLVINGTLENPAGGSATSITSWGVVTGTNALNFRSEPSFDSSNVQTELAGGTILCVLGYEGQWVHVQWGNRVGYVSADYLTIQDSYPGETGGDTSAVVSLANQDDAAALLESPSTTATVLKELANGVQVTVLSNDGSWCLVKVADVEGYLLTSQLDFDAAGNTIPDGEEDGDDNTGSGSSGEQEEPGTPPSSGEETTGSKAWVMRTVNYVNLRETASTSGKVITQIPAGDELEVLEKGGTFSKVSHGVGTGYVLSKHLTYRKPVETIGILYIDTVTDPLAMRNAADLYDSDVITYIPRGEKVLLIEEIGDWCHVQYGDYVGYCSAKYLSRTRPNEYEADDTPIYDPSLIAVSGWKAVVNTGGSALKVYEWCAGDSPVLTSVPNGNTVKLQARGEIWCKITFEGESGFCLTNKLVLLAPTAAE
nr:SpoIID/LytB domain-containing protein [Clostridia bacterium]